MLICLLYFHISFMNTGYIESWILTCLEPVEVCINLICVDFIIFHIVVLYLELVYFILV